MSAAAAEFGVIGLGRIGGNLALHALGMGMRVVGRSKSGVPDDLARAGLEEAAAPADFGSMLERPRKIFLYLPAGPVVDEVIEEIRPHLERGDIVIDGGNSYWGDSIRRHARLRAAGIHLLDVGTSGGVDGARNGACFMAGGDPEPVQEVEPILRALAVEHGYVHAGPPGSGHFVKLVHNGIEFGMLQAIGEGVALLERHHEQIDIAQVLECWRHGSVIRSWLVDLMAEAYRTRGGVSTVPPFIEDTGEVNWLVADALQTETPIPVISASVMQLFASRDANGVASRAIAMMRHGFGGHPFGPDESVAKERTTSRVGEIFRRDKQ